MYLNKQKMTQNQNSGIINLNSNNFNPNPQKNFNFKSDPDIDNLDKILQQPQLDIHEPGQNKGLLIHQEIPQNELQFIQ